MIKIPPEVVNVCSSIEDAMMKEQLLLTTLGEVRDAATNNVETKIQIGDASFKENDMNPIMHYIEELYFGVTISCVHFARHRHASQLVNSKFPPPLRMGRLMLYGKSEPSQDLEMVEPTR